MSDLITIPKQQDDVPWRPVRQRRDIAEHDEHRDHEQADDDRALCTHVRVRRRLQARRGAAHGDGVVHRLGEDEAEDGARHERGREVRREVVVDEQLAAHDVEREVVHRPDDEEEARRVPESVADGCRSASVSARLGCVLNGDLQS